MPSFALLGIVQHSCSALKQNIKSLHNLKLKTRDVCTMRQQF